MLRLILTSLIRNLQCPPSILFRDAGSWHTSNYATELKFGKQVKNHIWWQSMTSMMTPSSKYLVRNHKCPLRIDFKDGGSWHTSNHARELKVGTQVINHIWWQSMKSWMTPSSKYPVRNHQHIPSIDFKDRGFWHTCNHARELKFGTKVNNHIWWQSMKSMMTPSSKYPVRNHQHLPSLDFKDRGFWHTCNHAIELKFGTQVKKHIWWQSMMLMIPNWICDS